MSYLLYYLTSINLLTLFLMMLDKKRAKKGAYRISEKTLLLNIILGGFIGSVIGMLKIRHKNKKFHFIITTIVSSFLWILILIKVAN